MTNMDVNNMWKGYENGVQEKTNSSSSDSQICSSSATGPDPVKLKAILDRTNYSHQVTAGQRKYGGPPPDWPEDSSPPIGSEIFVGRVPKDAYEDELIVLFEKIGKLWDLRLMIDPVTSQSRGYAFITYCNTEDAQKAVQEFNGYKIRPKNFSLKVNISVPNLRLFIGNIPKIMSKEQIYNEFSKIAGLTEVITYSSPDDRKKNRGFCFLEFDSHKNASAAKRKLTTNGMKMFKCDILVDWADPQEEPDEETMSKVKVLYVRNLTSEVSENQLKELFEESGTIERVKKIKDYAFIHFEDRDQALTAMDKLNGKDYLGSCIEISLAKPPSDRRKKEEVLRNRERRMFLMMQQKQLMMAYPRVPPSQIRPPIQSIPPMAAPPVMPIRNGRNRFSQPMNPMMAPVAFNRQGQPWNPLMYYDPSEWWYNASRGGPQFNFPGMPPPGAHWNYGIPNGQVPQIPPYGPGSSGANNRHRNNHGGGGGGGLNHSNLNNGNASGNGGGIAGGPGGMNMANLPNSNHHSSRKWRKPNQNQNGSTLNNSSSSNNNNSNISSSNNNKKQ